jgi:hypothetical protein
LVTMADEKRLEGLLAFIRECRSNESNFTKLKTRLQDEAELDPAGEGAALASTYSKSKETSGSAWPEFENYVSFYEKAIVQALKEHH